MVIAVTDKPRNNNNNNSGCSDHGTFICPCASVHPHVWHIRQCPESRYSQPAARRRPQLTIPIFWDLKRSVRSSSAGFDYVLGHIVHEKRNSRLHGHRNLRTRKRQNCQLSQIFQRSHCQLSPTFQQPYCQLSPTF